jgi:hypothetical protein
MWCCCNKLLQNQAQLMVIVPPASQSHLQTPTLFDLHSVLWYISFAGAL